MQNNLTAMTYVEIPVVIPFRNPSRPRPFHGNSAPPWPPAVRLACFTGGSIAAWVAVLTPVFLI